jgi:glycosyltransferase involved in cell wall biosynthesis
MHRAAVELGSVAGVRAAVRILLITPVAPHPPSTGGRQRTNLLFRGLCSVGHTDTFLIAGEADVPDAERSRLAADYHVVGTAAPQVASEIGWVRHLRSLHPAHVNRAVNVLAPLRQYALPQPRVAAALRAAVDLDAYDVIVGRYLSALVAADVLSRERVVVDVDDLPTALIDMRLQSGVDGPIRRAYLRRIRSRLGGVERRQLAACAHVWVANPDDIGRIGHDRCSTLPNIPFVAAGQVEVCDEEIPQSPNSRTLLTVGMLNHVPNVQGIDHFLSAAWPAIRRRVPDAEYRIVGSRLMPDAAERWGRHPGVRVVGFVPDLRREYEAAAVTVCPIPWGGGTNIKVAESLAHGVPAIISPAAHRGWRDVFPEPDAVLVARTADDYAGHAATLLGDPARRLAMGEFGRRAVRASLRFATFRDRIAHTLASLSRSSAA